MTTYRRTTPATERVALDRLRGILDRPAYTAGRRATVGVALTDLLAAPGGTRDRQLNFGATVTVIDEAGDWCFVEAGDGNAAEGYCGWVAAGSLSGDMPTATHRVAAPATHVYTRPDIKQGEIMALSLGARLAVLAIEGPFARLATGGFVPAVHLSDSPARDPVTVAESLLGTPYLWGGNSRWGIDCSGLVQAALSACNIPCPGDSDQQWRSVGRQVPMAEVARGDLLFWHGHVAMAISPTAIIHANGHRMAVTLEDLGTALARIEAAGEGAFLGVRRPVG